MIFYVSQEALISNVIPSSLPILTMDMIPPESLANLPETEKFTVELRKDAHGLGITIAGYVCEKGKSNCFLNITEKFSILNLYVNFIFSFCRRVIWYFYQKY